MIDINNKPVLIQFHEFNAKNYQSVWDFQTILHERIKADKLDPSKRRLLMAEIKRPINHLIFCIHQPVYTLGKRADIENLLVSPKEIETKGFELFPINRGGDITYHGPGQITAYFIADLELLKRDVHLFVRNLEQTVINVLKEYGLNGERQTDLTGVWLKDKNKMSKICAIGVHLSRWVSMHGLAFNVTTELSHFDNIIPCGIADPGKDVTSLSKEIERPINVVEVKEKLKQQFQNVFGFQIIN